MAKFQYEIEFEPMEDGEDFTVTIVIDREINDPLDPWFYDIKGLGEHLMSEYYIVPGARVLIEDDEDDEETT